MRPSPSTRTPRNPRRIAAVAAAGVLCWAGTLGAALAQAAGGSGDIQPAHPCVAQPTDQANGSQGTDTAAPKPSLEDCDGVLAPPKTGDQEMRIEPPDTGATPVIPPGAVPEQSPK